MKINILGVPFDNVNRKEALDKLLGFYKTWEDTAKKFINFRKSIDKYFFY